MIARLIVSYTLRGTGSLQGGTIAVEIPGYEFLSADAVLERILKEVDDQYVRPVLNMIELTNVTELQPRKETPMTSMVTHQGHSCLACGEKNGHGGLPCPTMTPMA